MANPGQEDTDGDGQGDACDSTPGGGGSGGGGGNGGGGGSPGGQPPPADSPPVADFVYKASSPTVRRAVWLNGASSTAAPGRSIVSYAWDLTSDGRFDYVAGGRTPAISTTVRNPGRYTATLAVTDSAGQRDTFSQPYSVGRANTNVGSFTSFEQPASGPNQADRPGCMKTIAFAIVEVNGRGGSSQCFKIAYALPRSNVGRLFGARRSGGPGRQDTRQNQGRRPCRDRRTSGGQRLAGAAPVQLHDPLRAIPRPGQPGQGQSGSPAAGRHASQARRGQLRLQRAEQRQRAPAAAHHGFAPQVRRAQPGRSGGRIAEEDRADPSGRARARAHPAQLPLRLHWKSHPGPDEVRCEQHREPAGLPAPASRCPLPMSVR